MRSKILMLISGLIIGAAIMQAIGRHNPKSNDLIMTVHSNGWNNGAYYGVTNYEKVYLEIATNPSDSGSFTDLKCLRPLYVADSLKIAKIIYE